MHTTLHVFHDQLRHNASFLQISDEILSHAAYSTEHIYT